MRQHKCWDSTFCIVLVAAAWLACPLTFLAAQQTVKLTDQLVAPVPKGWRLAPQRARNLVEVVLPTSAKPHAPAKARVAISTEIRSDHSAALRRLQEIAAEQDAKARYLDVCGWPALERRSLVELKHVLAHGQSSSGFQPELTKTTVVTVAVAAENYIVRYEGTLRPDVPVAAAGQIVGLARRLQCPAKPPAGQTQRELQMLKATQFKLEPAASQATSQSSELQNSGGSLTLLGAAPLASSLAVPGTGELQIAVSNDGQRVFIASGSGTKLSKDGGLTFPTVSTGTWPGVSLDGDPSVGVGATGDFYLALLGKAANSCTASVAQSTDGGQTFSFRGHAAVCPGTGDNMCFPDQEQMAVDRTNKAAGFDQLYVVWRSFPNLNVPVVLRGCSKIHFGIPTPFISCSQDGGLTWHFQTAVGPGDIGRVAVGGDGYVYVTYISGANLMINKFSPCASGLKQQQPDFPKALATMRGVFCPVPGLDRCTKETEASPQPAVDDADPKHVLVAYADNDGNPNPKPNENVILLESRDGGRNWPGSIIMNSAVTARRFLPWLCVTQGISYVTWYDRRLDDLTAYFLNTATGALKKGTETDVSQRNDPQCKSGWPDSCSADSMSDIIGCPAGTPPIPGACKDLFGGGSLKPCTSSAPGCPFGESCQPTGNPPGCPKYGDYNGSACINGAAYVAWASGTPPPGVVGAPAGINVYTDRLNYPACGGQNQACCFHGQPCHDASLACNSSNICAPPCGDFTQPCCAQGAQCHDDLVCANNQCQCGFSGQPCCGANKTCQPGLACDINSKCVCGGLNQPCCDQQSGGTCNSSLACDRRDFLCRPTCGLGGQQCCDGTTCSAGLICAGGVCACGGQDQPCCDPNGTCNFGFKCAAGICHPGAGNCAQCEQKFTSCLKGCGNDAACQCLCRNDRCDCFQQNSCGKQCTFEDCSNR